MTTITKSFLFTGQFQTAEVPAGTTKLTVHLWGGGGGAGGPDSAGDGAPGAAGHFVTGADIDMTPYAGTKFIGVAVGGGGESGGMGNDTPGGRNGQSLTGYSGGTGGESGEVGVSGSGGGGGGATTVTIFATGEAADNTVLAIAGGGGGGGGTGESSRGGKGENSNTATSRSPGTLGENGAGHTGDGGGGGAGGGGKDGGTGGSGATGDAGGFGGKSGSNTVPSGGSAIDGTGPEPGSQDSAFYEAGVAKGGIRGAAGGGGKAVLIFTIPSATNFKVAGAYKNIDEIYVKVAGIWKEITQGYFKVGGVWKAIFTGDIIFTGNSAAFGNNSGGLTSGTEGSGGVPTPATIPADSGDGDNRFVPVRPKQFWRPNPHTVDGFSKADEDTGVSKGKVVCTMMNDTYGFGSFRNKIWHKFWQDKTFASGHNPIYEKGYHIIFKPLVKIAQSNTFISPIVRKILEHMGRHVTADMYHVMKGKKRDKLGRVYRAIFEPICWCLGKMHEKLSTTKANK
tara:strand:- start:1428 stop:2957 length:1530 start_codon:yes stop_codon:yes gene_type:complete